MAFAHSAKAFLFYFRALAKRSYAYTQDFIVGFAQKCVYKDKTLSLEGKVDDALAR